MTLVRAIGRTMLSSYFVLSGIRAVRNPGQFVADAEPLTDRLVPTAKRFAPDQVAGFIPEDTATLVRVNGVLQVAGGVALSSGKGRRLGAGLLALSMIPTTLARHPFWSRTDPEQKTRDRQQFVKNISLLGGVVIASRDTEGQPGLGWRATEGRELVAKRTKKAKKAAKKALQHGGSEAATAAIGGGLALVSDAVEESRKTRKQASRRAKEAAERAQKELKRTQKSARKNAKKSAKRAGESLSKRADKVSKRAEKAGKRAEKAGDAFQKSAHGAQQRALSTAGDVSKNVRKAADSVRSELGEHIQLGQN
jgi:uncharacterized membrane protein YphA (DoxX/SURF4 family)